MPSQFIMDKANQVLDHVSPNSDGYKEFDILAIASLIVGIVQIFQECRKNPAKAASQARNPGLLQRVRLRRYVRDKIGPEAYRRKGEEIVRGLFALGQNATPDDIKKLIQEDMS